MRLIKQDYGVSDIEFARKAMRAPFESFTKADKEKDTELLKNLASGGTEHRKVLRMINWNVELKAPRYWYQELDTYKVGTCCSSSSTMHLILRRPLTLDDFSYSKEDEGFVKTQIEHINSLLPKEGQLIIKKGLKQRIKQLLPEGYLQLRFYQFNYESLLTIYRQRKNHELEEWKQFCNYILTLPLMRELIDAVECKI